jgi:prepilin-type processing-associated H-X9-DG protein
LVVIAVISILIALLLPAVQAARAAARRSSCSNNLKQIGLALHNYESQYGSFPSGAHLQNNRKKGISWRVMLLPFIEQQTLYDEIKPLPNGEAQNWGPRTHVVDTYLCPSAPPPSSSLLALHPSNYAGVMGVRRPDSTNTAADSTYTGADRHRRCPHPAFEALNLAADLFCGEICSNGVLFPNSRVRLAKITDGTSKTFAVGEQLYETRDWLTGLTFEKQLPMLCTIATKNVVYHLNAEYETSIAKNNLPFASEHTGGAQFTMCDGSVHFFQESMDVTVLQDLATKRGGEVDRWEP